MVTIPYACSKTTHKLLHISQATSGAQGYYCPSCKMEMGARKGKINDHHFYHINSAKIACDISFWVSVRSMALQILDRTCMLSLPKASFISPQSKYTPIIPVKRKQPYDRSFKIFNTLFHIFFITPEDTPYRISSGSYRSANDYLETELVLEIDLTNFEMQDTEKQHYYLENIILHSLNAKKWNLPSSKISHMKKDFEEEQRVINEEFLEQYPFLEELNLTKKDILEQEEDFLSKTFLYYKRQEYNAYSNKSLTGNFHILDKQRKLGAYYVNKNVFCYCLFRDQYILYSFDKFSDYYEYTILDSVKDIEEYLTKLIQPPKKEKEKHYPKANPTINEEVKEEKKPPLILDIDPIEMSKDDWNAYERIPRFVDRVKRDCIPKNMTSELSWTYRGDQLYLLCYKYEFFFMANIAGSLVLFKLIDNRVKYIARSYSEAEMIIQMDDFLKMKIDQEAEELF